MDFISDFLMMDFLGKDAWVWLLFVGIVIFLLVLDLWVFHKESHEITVKESLWMSGGYITAAHP
jgi:tellurite resistance protein TerC